MMTDRRKRLKIRAWRRGMKEMDLILGRFADERLGEMAPAELDAFEALLDQPDQSLYAWITGRETPDPACDAALLAVIRTHCGAVQAPKSSPISR